MNAEQGRTVETMPNALTRPAPPKRRRWSAPARSLRVAAVATAFAAIFTTACDGGKSASTPTPLPAGASPVATAAASAARVTLSGHLTLDGAPAESRFLGVRVVRDGLSSACQQTIPSVSGGLYEISVLADADERGCGAPGASIVLWIVAGNNFVFSRETAPWPSHGGALAFDATFSSADPNGATKPVTEFKGHVFDRAGNPLPSGTVVEAYVDHVRCGLTSLRAGDEVERFYTLIVSGPESVAGCTAGAQLSFRLDGREAVQTAVHNLTGDAGGSEIDLTVK
jgi:hypothetical protein